MISRKRKMLVMSLILLAIVIALTFLNSPVAQKIVGFNILEEKSVRLENKYGSSLGHVETEEREDNKINIRLSSSPGIIGLIEDNNVAYAEIYGAENKKINLKIDNAEEEGISTDVFAAESVEIENATITLPKKGYVEYIAECSDFDIESFKCLGEWEKTDIPFTADRQKVTFTVTHFSGYGGGYDLDALVAGSCGGATTCSCGDTMISSRVLDATDAITTTTCTGDGLSINTSNVTLDCNGLAIIGNPAIRGTGVNATQAYNVTIQNCNISGFNGSISMYSVNNSNITSNRLSNATGSFGETLNGVGIYIESSLNITIFNNTFNYTQDWGIVVGSSDKVNILNNTMFGPGSGGIGLSFVTNSIVSGNNISDYTYGLYFVSSPFNNNINNNNIINSEPIYFADITDCDNNITASNIYIESNADGTYSAPIYFSNNSDVLIDNVNFGYAYACNANNINITNSAGNHSYGIYILHSNNSLISNVNLTNSKKGIIFSNSYFNKVSDTILHTLSNSNNDAAGIKMDTSSSNLIINNTIYNIQTDGIQITTSNYNNITNNTIYSTLADGIRIVSGFNNIVNNNIVYNHTERCIRLVTSDNNTVSRNTLYNASNGVYLSTSNYNSINNNTVYSTSSVGIRLDIASNNNTINSNTVHNTSSIGILLSSSNNNTLNYNNIYNTSSNGIRLSSSNYNTLNYNNITNSTTYGLFLSSAGNNTIGNNIIYANTGYDVYLDGAGSNLIENNTIDWFTSEGISLNGASYYNQIKNNIIYNNYTSATTNAIAVYTNHTFIGSNNVTCTNCNFVYASKGYNITIDHNIINAKGGITFINVSTNRPYLINITYNNITVASDQTGVSFTGTDNSSILHNYLKGGNNGIFINDGNSLNIINNTVTNASSSALSINYMNSSIIDSNIIIDNLGTSAEISLSYIYNNNITNNNLTNNSNANGILLNNDGSNNILSGNKIVNIANGIETYANVSSNFIINNTIKNSNYGIYIHQSSPRNLIENNTIDWFTVRGISLDKGDDYTQIRGNFLNNTYTAADTTAIVCNSNHTFIGNNNVTCSNCSFASLAQTYNVTIDHNIVNSYGGISVSNSNGTDYAGYRPNLINITSNNITTTSTVINQNPVDMSYVDNSSILHNHFRGGANGITLSITTNIVILNNTIANSEGIGIACADSNTTTAQENTIFGNKNMGIRDAVCTGSKYINNTIHSQDKSNGLYIYNSRNIIAEYNNISYNDIIGIDIANSDSINLTNNTISLNGIGFYYAAPNSPMTYNGINYSTVSFIAYNTSYSGGATVRNINGTENISLALINNGTTNYTYYFTPQTSNCSNAAAMLGYPATNCVYFKNNTFTSPCYRCTYTFDTSIISSTLNVSNGSTYPPSIYLTNISSGLIITNCTNVRVFNNSLSNNTDVGIIVKGSVTVPPADELTDYNGIGDNNDGKVLLYWYAQVWVVDGGTNYSNEAVTAADIHGAQTSMGTTDFYGHTSSYLLPSWKIKNDDSTYSYNTYTFTASIGSTSESIITNRLFSTSNPVIIGKAPVIICDNDGVCDAAQGETEANCPNDCYTATTTTPHVSIPAPPPPAPPPTPHVSADNIRITEIKTDTYLMAKDAKLIEDLLLKEGEEVKVYVTVQNLKNSTVENIELEIEAPDEIEIVSIEPKLIPLLEEGGRTQFIITIKNKGLISQKEIKITVKNKETSVTQIIHVAPFSGVAGTARIEEKPLPFGIRAIIYTIPLLLILVPLLLLLHKNKFADNLTAEELVELKQVDKFGRIYVTKETKGRYIRISNFKAIELDKKELEKANEIIRKYNVTPDFANIIVYSRKKYRPHILTAERIPENIRKDFMYVKFVNPFLKGLKLERVSISKEVKEELPETVRKELDFDAKLEAEQILKEESLEEHDEEIVEEKPAKEKAKKKAAKEYIEGDEISRMLKNVEKRLFKAMPPQYGEGSYPAKPALIITKVKKAKESKIKPEKPNKLSLKIQNIGRIAGEIYAEERYPTQSIIVSKKPKENIVIALERARKEIYIKTKKEAEQPIKREKEEKAVKEKAKKMPKQIKAKKPKPEKDEIMSRLANIEKRLKSL